MAVGVGGRGGDSGQTTPAIAGNASGGQSAGGVGGAGARAVCPWHPPAETLDAIFCNECGVYKPTKAGPLTWWTTGGASSAATWTSGAGHAAGARAEQSTGDATITIEGRPVRVEGYAELNELASRMATAAKVAGCRGAVVALSIEKGGHSYFDVRVMGPCLEIEGLASHIPDVLAGLWPKDGAK